MDRASKVSLDFIYNISSAFIGAYWVRCLIYLTIATVSVALYVATPVILGSAVDRIGTSNPYKYFIIYSIVFSAASVAIRAQTYISEIISSNIIYYVSQKFFQSILAKNIRYFSNSNGAEIQSAIIQGQNSVKAAVGIVFFSIYPASAQIIVTLLVLSNSISIYIALSVFLYGLLYAFIVWFVNAYSRRFLEIAVSHIQTGARDLGSAVLGISTIQYFGAEDWAAAKYNNIICSINKNWSRWATIQLNFSVIFGVLIFVQLFINYSIIIPAYQTQKISVGDVVVFNAMILQLNAPLEILGNVIGQFLQALTIAAPAAVLWFADELELDESCVGQFPTPTSVDSLRVEKIAYSNGSPGELALQTNLSFECRKGQVTFITGESGTGKSTLLRVLARVIAPSYGSVQLDQIRIGEFSRAQWNDLVAIVPQETFLLSGTIRDNICMGRSTSPYELDSALKGAALEEVIANLKDGLETDVGEGGCNLSGGERQRVCIARAILKKPQILLLDEASSALDKRTESLIMEKLRSIAHAVIVIAVSHRHDFFESHDQIITITRQTSVSRHPRIS